jgi:murein DD-endopeptidase MepM/ murein hydrolase activator NlpD
MIEVDHGGGLTTRYAHLSRIEVAVGTQIARGQLIGEVGSTGRSTGPHLHYEVRIDGESVNPLAYLPAKDAGTTDAATKP